jgi:hypothetical protein
MLPKKQYASDYNTMHVPSKYTAHDPLFYTGCQMEYTVVQTLCRCAIEINDNMA